MSEKFIKKIINNVSQENIMIERNLSNEFHDWYFENEICKIERKGNVQHKK